MLGKWQSKVQTFDDRFTSTIKSGSARTSSTSSGSSLSNGGTELFTLKLTVILSPPADLLIIQSGPLRSTFHHPLNDGMSSWFSFSAWTSSLKNLVNSWSALLL